MAEIGEGRIMPGRDGIPSVTEVLGCFTDFSMINPAVLKHACDRGTKTHNAIAAHLSGLWVSTLDDEVQPYFDSFRRWADIMLDRVILVENEGICDCYNFMGHYDAVVILKGEDRPTLIDWKSPISGNRTWICQCSAYCHLAEKHSKVPVNRCGCVMLSPKGKTAKMQDYTSHRNEAFSVFLAALTAFKWLKK